MLFPYQQYQPEEIKSFFGQDFTYASETDDEDEKYVTKKNKYFWRLRRTQREQAVLKLWRRCFVKALSCVVMKNRFDFLNTKVMYFGSSIINDNSQKNIDSRKIRGYEGSIRINPNSSKLMWWNLLNIFLILYNASATPFRVAFHTSPTSALLFAFETCTDLVFLIDIFVTFLIPYERESDGKMEMSLYRISARYMLTHFMGDLVSVFPTQFIEAALPVDAGLYEVHRINQKNNMQRMIRVIKFVKLAKYTDHFEKLLLHFKIDSLRASIIIGVTSSCFMVHIFACMFYFASKYNEHMQQTWVYQTGNTD